MVDTLEGCRGALACVRRWGREDRAGDVGRGAGALLAGAAGEVPAPEVAGAVAAPGAEPALDADGPVAGVVAGAVEGALTGCLRFARRVGGGAASGSMYWLSPADGEPPPPLATAGAAATSPSANARIAQARIHERRPTG